MRRAPGDDDNRIGPPDPTGPALPKHDESGSSAWAQLIGPCLDLHDVAALLSLPQDEVATMPGLVRLAGQGGPVFPVFQFSGTGVRAGLPAVLQLLDGGLLPLTIAGWFRTPSRDLHGRTPIEALIAGDFEFVERLAAQTAFAARDDS